MFTKEFKTFYISWAAILLAAIYCTSIGFKFLFGYGLLFIICVAAGIAFDFYICRWQHFTASASTKIDQSAPQRVAYKYEHFDLKWTNLQSYLLLFLFGAFVFILQAFVFIFISSQTVNWWNIGAMTGVLIPYFFHRAYYYSVRIPGLRTGVYVHEKSRKNCRSLVEEMKLLRERSDSGTKTDFSKLVLLNKRATVEDKSFEIQAIPRNWSHENLLDFIFFQNNQTEVESYYKNNWDHLPIYRDNDLLVKTCWTVKMEKGTWANNTHSAEIVQNFTKKEFHDKSMEENLFFWLTRII